MDQKFNQTVLEIIQHDQRYHADAYEFVNSAVSYTVKKLSRDRKPSGNRHDTAEELVAGSLDYAVSEYGFLAAAVIRSWGLLSGEDFGNIVYNMIDAKLLSASKDDSPADFLCHPDLADELQHRIDSRLLVPDPPPPPVLD